jgi:uncharacterized membrane protein YqiK
VTNRWIQIIDTTSGNRVITAIEILSPWNKMPGKLNEGYIKKLEDYRRGQVSLVEIDLLRHPRRGRLVVKTPVIETASFMDMTTIPIYVAVQNAYSKNSIPLEVHAIANVKLSGHEEVVMNAVERFLGRDRSEIQRVAKETLEGALRGVLARLTPEEVNEDRLKFAGEISEEVGEDLAKLGLQVDTLKIQSVSDEKEYLDSIGRVRIAEAIQRAEIAESNARNEANKEAAIAKAFAADMAMRVTTDAVQIYGGMGYTKWHPVEKLMRDAKVIQIYEGSAQIMRKIIARHLLEKVR